MPGRNPALIKTEPICRWMNFFGRKKWGTLPPLAPPYKGRGEETKKF